MKKRIKIFLASSIKDLEEDRHCVGDFLGQLNNIYDENDIFFKLIKCENYDNSISIGGKQAEFDREITESDLVFFLFFRKVGDYTKHEFEIALDAFKEKAKPKIVTYFKYVNSADEVTEEVEAFKKILDEELRHYYSLYNHIDTLKLGILMQIKLMGLDSHEVKIQDGEVYFDNVFIANTENIPIINGNRELQELTRKKSELERRIIFLNSTTEENKQAHDEAKAELRKVSEQLTEIEKQTLEFMSTVAEMTSDSRVLTYRQKEALKDFNQGDYDTAQDILSDEEREQELLRAETLVESGKKEIQGYINEDLLWIKAERMRGITEARINNIDRRYSRIEELLKKYGLDTSPLAESYAETIAAYVGCDVNIFFDSKMVIKAEEHIRKAILHTKNFVERAEEKNDSLAKLYVRVGVFYKLIWRFDSHRGMEFKENALKYLSEGVRLYEALETETPNRYTAELADSYFELGKVCHICSDDENTEKYCLMAIEKYEQLDLNSAKNRSSLAKAYNYAGDFYGGRYVNDKEEAEKCFRKAIEIRSRLAEEDLLAYGEELGETYVSLYLYLERHNFDEAMSCLSKLLGLYQRLADIDLERYCEELYVACFDFASIGKERNAFTPQTVEGYVTDALKVYETLAEKYPDTYDRKLASCYENAGEFYFDDNNIAKAELYFLKAADVWKRLAAKKPEKNIVYLARTYERIGFAYRGAEKGRAYWNMALEVLETCPDDPKCRDMAQRIKRDLSNGCK